MQLVNEDGNKVNLERPKVLYNQKTGKFVMWVHYENGKDYHDAAVAVATCDTPDGDFVYHGHFNPYGYMSRDCTLFQDDDGTVYFISASRDNADPAVVKIDRKYYMLSSFCTGWAPNQGKYAVADAMEGDWGTLAEIGDGTTYQSQPAFIIHWNGRVLYYGDRWGGDGSRYFESGYVVYPLALEGDRLVMEHVEQIEL